ncbi:MAG TPA: CoA-binding protein [Anaerolineaceae bacterium]|nr:CoA-binding protein [Anaerolineaceae bacterium]HPN53184.1 CoA-binding protein [Anaerolineaceae bacterium]
MTAKADIDLFLSQKTIAVVGASRNKAKFGYTIFNELKTRGYKVYPVNPNAESIDGTPCFASLAALPEVPGGVICVTPPPQTEKAVAEALGLGVRSLWLQQGAESASAVESARKAGAAVVSGECVFMFLPNGAWFHRFHGWINGLMGKTPK